MILLPSRLRGASVAAIVALSLASQPASGQSTQPPRDAEKEVVRSLLSALAADSMEGRGTGTVGSVKASNLIAAEFRKIGLEPVANGGYFQDVPLERVSVGASSAISVGGQRLNLWTDFSLAPRVGASALKGEFPVVFGGAADDSTYNPASGSLRGKIVLIVQPAGAGGRGGRGRAGGGGRGGGGANARFADAAALLILGAADLSGRVGGASQGVRPAVPPMQTSITVSRSAAELLLGAAPETLTPGAVGRTAVVDISYETTGLPARNVAGILRGTDPALRDEFILVDAHYDHLGIRASTTGDSIFNGADDDASGTVAVIEIARSLAAGPPPRRSLIFIATTGEEVGLLGTNYFIANPIVPLDKIVANLEIEMIGRPDSLAGGSGRGWLTGYERSTMGPMLAAAGLAVVQDPRPDQNFFSRSDNIAFARMGIVAHTLSSFNLHSDYHRASDDVDKVDFDHMTALINVGIRAAALLANGPAQNWLPGGRPGGNF